MFDAKRDTVTVNSTCRGRDDLPEGKIRPLYWRELWNRGSTKTMTSLLGYLRYSG